MRAIGPGSVIANDFEIVSPLSAGGMGSVYVALQRSTGKRRALKLMLPQLVSDAGMRKRFEQEAKIAALIASDHVVEVVGAGVENESGIPWLAMELLEGSDLAHAIEKQGPMTPKEAHRVLKQVCHALGAAHAGGIVHRDLKPENIFLARSRVADESFVVKVLDFGIAKISIEAATKDTAAMGSPIWMAPEQTERGRVTPAADVWALGLIAFYLLTGVPFWLSAQADAGSLQALLREVLLDPIPTATDRARRFGMAEALPQGFDAWFARCVARDPSARFQDAGVAFARFDGMGEESLVATQPAFARPPSPQADTGPVRGVAAVSMSPSRRRDTTPRLVRPGVVVGGLLALAIGGGAYGLLALRTAKADPPNDMHVTLGDSLPPELASTPGAAWFRRVHARCNPIEADVVVSHDPPPHTKDGSGFAAACFALAGKLPRARSYLDALPADERAYGSWCVFEVVHPVADRGDDAAAGAAMRLVLEYWPDNYMALYHAGMAEYATNERLAAQKHLRRFLELYSKNDGFTNTARRVLAELDGANHGGRPDCSKPLAVDPEGRSIYASGCAESAGGPNRKK